MPRKAAAAAAAVVAVAAIALNFFSSLVNVKYPGAFGHLLTLSRFVFLQFRLEQKS